MERAALHSPRLAAFPQQQEQQQQVDGVPVDTNHYQQHQQFERRLSESERSAVQEGGDDDERMSDDESMSSSSSLDIEDVESAISEFQSVDAFQQQQQQREQQQQQQQQMVHEAMLQRSASVSESYLQHQQQQHLHQQDTHHQAPTPPHSQQQQQHLQSLNFDYTSSAAALQSAENEDESVMWLLTQFAPAMSKAVRRRSIDKSERMEDESNQGDGEGQARRANWRVKWATEDSSSLPQEFADGVHHVAARNEVTGIQLRLSSNKDFQVATDCANWFQAQGHAPRARVHADVSFVPPHLQVQMFVVGYVEDENGDLTMEYFDNSGVSSATDRAREHAIYIRLRVALNVRPGGYEIPIRVFTQKPGFTDEQLTWSSCVNVRVADVALPSPSDWKFHLDLWQHFSSIARVHGAALWSDRHFALIENYLSTLSEFGQKCITIVATEMPWAGQQCYLETKYPSALFEHAILDVYETTRPMSSETADSGAHGTTAATTIAINFQHFDRLLGLASKYKMDAEIEIFGLLSIWRDPANGFGGPVNGEGEDPTIHHHHHHQERRKRSSSSASSSSSPDRQGMGEQQISSSIEAAKGLEHHDSSINVHSSSSSSAQAKLDAWRIRCFNRQAGKMRYLRRVTEIETFVTLLYEHCVALGIVERVRVCADEPSELGLFYDQMHFLQRLAPGFKIKLAMNNLEFLNFAPPQVIDYVPLLPLVCADLELTKRVKAQIHERGGKFCWYVCCRPQFPNQFVSSPLIEGELIGYLTFFLELDGFLRWNYCLWPSKPWENLKWRSSDWKVGDMYFVLPGKDGYPVETLRLESLRFAIQVYELLRMAKESLGHAQLEQLKSEIAQLIWRSPSDFAQFCKTDDKSRSDLYSLDPLDYQRAKVLIIETLAAARLASSSSHSSGSGSTMASLESPPNSRSSVGILILGIGDEGRQEQVYEKFLNHRFDMYTQMQDAGAWRAHMVMHVNVIHTSFQNRSMKKFLIIALQMTKMHKTHKACKHTQTHARCTREEVNVKSTRFSSEGAKGSPVPEEKRAPPRGCIGIRSKLAGRYRFWKKVPGPITNANAPESRDAAQLELFSANCNAVTPSALQNIAGVEHTEMKRFMDSEVAYNDSGCSNFRTSLENSEEGACDLHRPHIQEATHTHTHTYRLLAHGRTDGQPVAARGLNGAARGQQTDVDADTRAGADGSCV